MIVACGACDMPFAYQETVAPPEAICEADPVPVSATAVSAIPVMASGCWEVAVTSYRRGDAPVMFRTANPP